MKRRPAAAELTVESSRSRGGPEIGIVFNQERFLTLGLFAVIVVWILRVQRPRLTRPLRRFEVNDVTLGVDLSSNMQRSTGHCGSSLISSQLKICASSTQVCHDGTAIPHCRRDTTTRPSDFSPTYHSVGNGCAGIRHHILESFGPEGNHNQR